MRKLKKKRWNHPFLDQKIKIHIRGDKKTFFYPFLTIIRTDERVNKNFSGKFNAIKIQILTQRETSLDSHSPFFYEFIKIISRPLIKLHTKISMKLPEYILCIAIVSSWKLNETFSPPSKISFLYFLLKFSYFLNVLI